MGDKESHLVCQECGYDMHDRKGGDICPECGKPLDIRRDVPNARKKSRNAILWLSISIFILPFVGYISLIPFMLGCYASSHILRKTTYHRVPHRLKKRLRIISILMLVYGIEFAGWFLLSYIIIALF